MTWLLLGNNYQYASKRANFIVPNGIQNGQYTLICQASSNGQRLASSKVIVIKGEATQEPLIDKPITDGEFAVYPNPAIDRITIKAELTDFANAVISIRNISGQTIIPKVTLKSKFTEINISALQKGVYVVDFYCDGIIFSSKKLVKL
jgi:hypothetical protein